MQILVLYVTFSPTCILLVFFSHEGVLTPSRFAFAFHYEYSDTHFSMQNKLIIINLPIFLSFFVVLVKGITLLHLFSYKS